ncbi:MAG: penicillin-binding protein activator [Euryarchaeota archaeon]|nr:penicillin-binding protein activator [Euryarchaeota archaeon]
MRKMFLSGIVAFIVVAVSTAGCTSNVQTGTTQPKTVLVGALVPLTGTAASTGANVNSTIRVAVADVNEYFAATDANVRVQLVVKDTGTTPDGALAAMNALHAGGVTAVVGPYSSAELSAVAPYAQENGMVLINYGSTAPSLNVARENVFRIVPDDSHQGPALATVMQEEGVRLLIPFVRDDVYGNGLINATRTAFEQHGGVVIEETRFAANTTNFSGALAAVRPQLTLATAAYGLGSVGVLFIGFENNTVPMLTAAGSDSQWSGIRWYGVAATPINTILANGTAAESAARLNYTAVQQIDGQGERYDRLMQNASVQRTIQTPYGSFAYDAVWIMARAIAETNGGNSTALREAIPRVASSYTGITGNTTLNTVGDRAYANYDFWTIRSHNGTYVKVKTAQSRTDPVSGISIVQLSTTIAVVR